jgi:hypothetical protein
MTDNFSGYSPIPYYHTGDPLLERDRVPMQFLAGNGSPLDEGGTKALEFLKLSPDEIKQLKILISTAINIATSITNIVGAAGTVIDLAKKLGIFGNQEKSIESYLHDIMDHVELIYNFLREAEMRGLVKEAIEWRADVDLTRVNFANTRISRSDNVLDEAERLADDMSSAIFLMLDPRQAKISFNRDAYGNQSPHWADLAVGRLMTLANGADLSLNDKGVIKEIWDAGHYIDVLVYALRERLLMTSLLEPIFKSTGYDRQKLKEIANNIGIFVKTWRANLLVMNYDLQIPDSGVIYNPRSPYPSSPVELKRSIIVGAVDPVTGISSIDLFGDFETMVIENQSPVGLYSTVLAVDVQAARQAARGEHAKRVDEVVRACGILDLEQLGRSYSDAASLPMRSQFVRLSTPWTALSLQQFDSIEVESPLGAVIKPVVLEGQPEEVTLGDDLAAFSENPTKTYSAQRFFRGGGKSTEFQVALRGDRTETQLGYRAVVCGKEIDIVPFSFGGTPGSEFPANPIELEEHSFNTMVWNVCQSKHLTFAEEKRLESEPNDFMRVENNRRPGRAKVQIRVVYTPPAGDSVLTYVGKMSVKIWALEPEAFPNAFAATVDVFEKIVGEDGHPTEILADSITTTITASYLIVEKAFFEDRWKAFEAMLRSVSELVQENADLPPIGPIMPEEPDWQRRFEVTLQSHIAWLKTVERINPDLVRSKIGQLQIPFIRR